MNLHVVFKRYFSKKMLFCAQYLKFLWHNQAPLKNFSWKKKLLLVNFPRSAYVLWRFLLIKFSLKFLGLHPITCQFLVNNQRSFRIPSIAFGSKVRYFYLRSIHFQLFEERRTQKIFDLRLLEIKESFGFLSTAKLWRNIFLAASNNWIILILCAMKER